MFFGLYDISEVKMYEIKQVLNDIPGKFSAIVSFNGGADERYEVDSLDPDTIDKAMTLAAEQILEAGEKMLAEESMLNSIVIEDGKVKV